MNSNEMEIEFGVTTNLNQESILFNNFRGYKHELINVIILIVKQYIYACRCEKVNPSLFSVKSRILPKKKIEEVVARRKNLIFRHKENWN